MVEWPLPTEFVYWITLLSEPLHGRLAWRLLPLLRGLLFAHGRRTAASWLRAAGLGKDFRQYYYFLGSLGRKTEYVASRLLRLAVAGIEPGERLLLGLDDTPTKRAGPQVEGAGLHHNPSPGPAGAKLLYGHLGVTLAWVVRHPRWGAIGLPLRALLYVRQKQIALLTAWYGVTFQTKLELAARLVRWAADWLRSLGKPLWVVADGAYAKRPFLKAARQAKVVVVSRLRKDARLWSVPQPPRPGAPKRRGPKPTYPKELPSGRPATLAGVGPRPGPAAPPGRSPVPWPAGLGSAPPALGSAARTPPSPGSRTPCRASAGCTPAAPACAPSP
jgi:hypothetical protein